MARQNAIAEGIGRGIVNVANQYAQRKSEEREQSRVRDLLGRLSNASDIEKVQIYGQIDPKLALGYQIAAEKNAIKKQSIESLNRLYGGNETPQMPTGEVEAPEQENRPGFTPNAPAMASRNAITNQMMQGVDQNYNPYPPQGEPPGNAPQGVAPPQQQLTPRQQAQRLRALGAQAESISKGAGKAAFEQANSLEKNEIEQNKINLKREQIERADYKDQQKDIAKIQESTLDDLKSSENTVRAIDDQLSVVDKTGQISAANLSNWLRSKGYDTLANAAQSAGGAIFATAGKEIITGGLKNAFGARPLGIEFEAFEAMLAQVGRSPAVNRLVLNSLRIPYDISRATAKFKMDLIAQNPNISPVELNSATYKFGEQYRDQALDSWKQQVNEAMNSQDKGFFSLDKTPTKQAQSQSWQDLWK